MSECYSQLHIEIGCFLPQAEIYALFNEGKNCKDHPQKILVNWNVRLYQLSQEDIVISFHLYFGGVMAKSRGFGGFFYSPGGRYRLFGRCWTLVQTFLCVFSCLTSRMKMKIFISIKKGPKLLQKVSLI